MIKKLTKHGNSHALIIDKPILKLLNIKDNTKLEIRIEDNSLIITPVQRKTATTKKVSSDKKMQKILEEALEKYDKTFRKLAKN